MSESDEALMLAAGRGDRAACERLVERHLGRIVNVATLSLGNRADGEEAAQEVFLRVWAAAPRWKKTDARFTTWLYRVVVRVCLDRLARRRERTSEHGDLEARDTRPGPRRIAEQAEAAAHVRDAIAELPESQRMALALCYFRGLRNDEAAEALDVSVEALESLLSRARRTLRDKLQELAPQKMAASR